MKKLLVAAAALAVAIIGFGALGAATTQADPTGVLVINSNVAFALESAVTPAIDCDNVAGAPVVAPPCDLTTAAGRAAVDAAIGLQTLNDDSADQVGPTGGVVIIVQTDDPAAASTVTLNGKGLTCTPVCDAVSPQAPDPTDKAAAWTVTAAGSFTGGTVTAIQAPTNVALDSAALTLVGAPTNLTAAVASKTTLQEKGAATCALTDDITDPTRAGLLATVVDINNNSLVGVPVTWSSSSTSTMKVALAAGITLNIADVGIGAPNVACGVAPGTADARVTVAGGVLTGQTTAVTRATPMTVTGVPAAVAITASPAAIPCDGTATSTVTATVTDSAGNNVVDGTPVTFSVVALGTANPINTTTATGAATSTITPLSGGTAGVVVNVTSGSAASSIRIDCLPSLATATAAAGGATATPGTGVTPPNTGTGGFASNDSSGSFPMWALLALALGSFVLVGGGIVARRTK